MSDTTLPTLAHPAPQRGRVGRWRLLAAIFGAPAAWLLQMSLSEPLAAQSCYPHAAPLPTPLWPSLQAVLAMVSVGALVLALACTLLAWRAWRITHPKTDGGGVHTMEVGGGRAGFLAGIGIMTSIFFVVAILITGLAVLLVSPCMAWGGAS